MDDVLLFSTSLRKRNSQDVNAKTFTSTLGRDQRLGCKRRCGIEHRFYIIGENNFKYNPRFSPDGKYVLYSEIEYRREPGVIIRTANRLIVVNNRGKSRKVLKIPKNWRFETAAWAAQGTEILIAATPNGLNGPRGRPNFDIYRYRLSTGQLTRLTNHPDHRDSTPHWTRYALSVSSQDKLKTQWGAIKRKK